MVDQISKTGSFTPQALLPPSLLEAEAGAVSPETSKVGAAGPEAAPADQAGADAAEDFADPDPMHITGSLSPAALIGLAVLAEAAESEASGPAAELPAVEGAGAEGLVASLAEAVAAEAPKLASWLTSPLEAASQLLSGLAGGAADAVISAAKSFTSALSTFQTKPTELATFVDTLGQKNTALLMNKALQPATQNNEPIDSINEQFGAVQKSLYTLVQSGHYGTDNVAGLVNEWVGSPDERVAHPGAPTGVVNPQLGILFAGLPNDGVGLGMKNVMVATLGAAGVQPQTALSASIKAMEAEVLASTPPTNQIAHLDTMQAKGTLDGFVKDAASFEPNVTSLFANSLEAKNYLLRRREVPPAELTTAEYNGIGKLMNSVASFDPPAGSPLNTLPHGGSLDALKVNCFDAVGDLYAAGNENFRNNALLQHAGAELFSGQFDSILGTRRMSDRTLQFVMDNMRLRTGQEESEEPEEKVNQDRPAEGLSRPTEERLQEQLERQLTAWRDDLAQLTNQQFADQYGAAGGPGYTREELQAVASTLERLLSDAGR
ncbi:MAG: hypothetical protein HYV63_21090 [Candidatus Schekmanbacteria bacterium]|nr:hypothetical protein [Candidatus Schekmanbacteria bacterium]